MADRLKRARVKCSNEIAPQDKAFSIRLKRLQLLSTRVLPHVGRFAQDLFEISQIFQPFDRARIDIERRVLFGSIFSRLLRELLLHGLIDREFLLKRLDYGVILARNIFCLAGIGAQVIQAHVFFGM